MINCSSSDKKRKEKIKEKNPMSICKYILSQIQACHDDSPGSITPKLLTQTQGKKKREGDGYLLECLFPLVQMLKDYLVENKWLENH